MSNFHLLAHALIDFDRVRALLVTKYVNDLGISVVYENGAEDFIRTPTPNEDIAAVAGFLHFQQLYPRPKTKEPPSDDSPVKQ